MSQIDQQTPADAERIAAEKGMYVVYPAPNQLLVDIDSEAQYGAFLKNAENLVRIGLMRSYRESPSPSAEPFHFHITVTLSRNVADVNERIFLQAILGSDPIRECLSYVRHHEGNPTPTIFFEKIQYAEVVSP